MQTQTHHRRSLLGDSGPLTDKERAQKIAESFTATLSLAGIEPLLAGLGKWSRGAAILDGAEVLLGQGQAAAADLLLQVSGLREVRR